MAHRPDETKSPGPLLGADEEIPGENYDPQAEIDDDIDEPDEDDEDEDEDDGDEDEDGGTVTVPSFRTQREAYAHMLECAPVGSEIVMCRNRSPSCMDHAEAVEAARAAGKPEPEHTTCKSCGVLEVGRYTTVDDLILVATLN